MLRLQLPEYSVYRQLQPQPLLKVLSEDPTPILRKFVRGLKFYFRNLGRLIPWAALVVMALALMVYLRGSVNKSPCPLRPNAEHPMTIIPGDSLLGPVVAAGLTLVLLIIQYSFFDHSLRHLLVLYPVVVWELALLVSKGLGEWKGKGAGNRWAMVLPAVFLTALLIKVSLQSLPGWENAEQQARQQASSLEGKTNRLQKDPAAVPFVKSSAAPWYADRPAVWDPEDEDIRNTIRGKLLE